MSVRELKTTLKDYYAYHDPFKSKFVSLDVDMRLFASLDQSCTDLN